MAWLNRLLLWVIQTALAPNDHCPIHIDNSVHNGFQAIAVYFELKSIALAYVPNQELLYLRDHQRWSPLNLFIDADAD